MVCTSVPTSEAGAVAPDSGAETSDTGIPARMAAVSVSTVPWQSAAG